MKKRKLLAAIALVIVTAISSPAAADQPKGAIGFTVQVEGDGSFWKPVIKSATVVEVRSGSPAEAAGLEAGDEIIEIQGVQIADANARKVAKLVEVSPGELLLLKVRNPAGETREVQIIAGEERSDAG